MNESTLPPQGAAAMEEQLPLLPYACGFIGCEELAVCALQLRRNRNIRPNVCVAHFELMMGHPFTTLAEEMARS